MHYYKDITSSRHSLSENFFSQLAQYNKLVQNLQHVFEKHYTTTLEFHTLEKVKETYILSIRFITAIHDHLD